jgi:adhesin/invasin
VIYILSPAAPSPELDGLLRLTLTERWPVRLSHRLLACFLTATAFACDSGDLIIPPTPARIEMVQGNGQLGSPGTPLPVMLIVKVLDEQGQAVAGVPVAFRLTDPSLGGSVAPDTVLTDSRGLAAARWTLGSSGPQAVNAEVVGAPLNVNFIATGEGESPGGAIPSGTRSTISVDPSTIDAGAGTATVTVTVLDDGGNPVSGATVTLQASGGGNNLSQPSGATGSSGTATGTISSSIPGTKVISALINGSIPVSQTGQVTVTAAPAAPVARIEAIEGDNQNTPAGNEVPIRPAVRVVNAEGNPVAGLTVTFVVTDGGGSVVDGTQVTNSEGIARVGSWRLGPDPGVNRLEARAGSLEGSPVVFTAQGTSGGGVDHFVFWVQPPDAETFEFFTVEVALVDGDGNLVPISGIEIYLGLFPQGSSDPDNTRLLGDRFRDTENGIATFNLAVNRNGTYRFRALSDELPFLGPHGPEPYLFSETFQVR